MTFHLKDLVFQPILPDAWLLMVFAWIDYIFEYWKMMIFLILPFFTYLLASVFHKKEYSLINRN